MKYIYDYSKLKGKIAENNLNNKKFAELIGMSITGLYNILSGKSYFNQVKIEKAKEILNIRDDEVYPTFFKQKVK